MGDHQQSELINYHGDYELELAAGSWTTSVRRDGQAPASAEVTVSAEEPRIRLDVETRPVGRSLADDTITGSLTAAERRDGNILAGMFAAGGSFSQGDTIGWIADGIIDGELRKYGPRFTSP